MRILFLSCHEILEFDEVKLLHELGHYVFSPGAYVEPRNRGDQCLRPGIPSLVYDPEDVEAYNRIPCEPGQDRKNCLTREFVDRFDAVIVMHLPQWLHNNWEVMRHKFVILRTIGQNISNNEQEIKRYRDQGMKIVRYSPRERMIPHYVGEDAMVRFYKDPEEFGLWNGSIEEVLTFNQHLPERRQACNGDLYEQVTASLPRALYGPGNEAIGRGVKGKVPFVQLKQAMQDYRAYFYLGTHPASYTLNFIEAWMTGIPIVAPGPEYGDAKYFSGHHLYEVHELLDGGTRYRLPGAKCNGSCGFWYDDPKDMELCLRRLLDDRELAEQVGAAGRMMAMKTFGKNVAMAGWSDFFRRLTHQ